MITFDEKIVAVWFLNLTPDQDWLAAVRELEPDKEYELTYRFRYYDGDQTKTPFEDGDKKNWYKGKIHGTREYVIRAVREVVHQFEKVARSASKPYELINDKGLDEFFREFQNAPFVYARQVSKEEYEELTGDGAGRKSEKS